MNQDIHSVKVFIELLLLTLHLVFPWIYLFFLRLGNITWPRHICVNMSVIKPQAWVNHHRDSPNIWEKSWPYSPALPPPSPGVLGEGRGPWVTAQWGMYAVVAALHLSPPWAWHAPSGFVLDAQAGLSQLQCLVDLFCLSPNLPWYMYTRSIWYICILLGPAPGDFPWVLKSVWVGWESSLRFRLN